MEGKFWADETEGSCNWCRRHLDVRSGMLPHRTVHVRVLSNPEGGGHEFRFCADCVIEAYERREADGGLGTFSGNLLDLLHFELLKALYVEATEP